MQKTQDKNRKGWYRATVCGSFIET